MKIKLVSLLCFTCLMISCGKKKDLSYYFEDIKNITVSREETLDKDENRFSKFPINQTPIDSVSTLSGKSIDFSTPDGEISFNINFEESLPQYFERDTAVVLKYLRLSAEQSEMKFRSKEIDGYTVYGYDSDGFSSSNHVMGTHVLFYKGNRIYFYIFNTENDMESYYILKNTILRSYIKHLNRLSEGEFSYTLRNVKFI